MDALDGETHRASQFIAPGIRQTYIERQLQNLDSNHDGQFDPSELSVIKTLAGNPVLSRDQVAEKLAEIYDKAMAELDLRQRNKR